MTEQNAFRTLVAYHEAGHAVMALALDMAVDNVTIEPNLTGGVLGWTSRPNDAAISDALDRTGDDSVTWRRLLFYVAGPMAQAMSASMSPYYKAPAIDWFGEWRESWSDDYEDALECCTALNLDAPDDALRQAEMGAYSLLCARWPQVEDLAERLLTESVVTLVSEEMEVAIGNRRAFHAALASIAALAGGWCKLMDQASRDPDAMEHVASLTADTMAIVMRQAADALQADGADLTHEVDQAFARLSDSLEGNWN